MQQDLVSRARGGDHDAFAELAAGALSRLHRTARLIVRDDDRASDAVQEALLEAWRDIKSLRDPDRFDAWLYRLLVRACYREAGRNRRRGAHELHGAVVEAVAPVDVAHGVALRDQLDRGFRALTPQHRAVLVVHHYLGLPDAEAAEALGIAIGTFKSRLNRAKGSLRAALDADAQAPEGIRESLA